MQMIIKISFSEQSWAYLEYFAVEQIGTFYNSRGEIRIFHPGTEVQINSEINLSNLMPGILFA